MRLIPPTLLLLVLPLWLHAAPVALFDGKSLAGWEGETTKVWRVKDGVIVGGSLDGNPQNEFLATRKTYRNFVLRLEYKLVGTEGFVNGGVQIRSRRVQQPPNEMIGYQADIGAGYSGFLYDESRRKKMLATADKQLITSLEKPGDWNRYEIRCEGPRIQIRLNDKGTVDYTEREPGIEQDGFIALQIHGDCKAEIAFRNITIEELPGTAVPAQAEILQRFGEPIVDKKAMVPFEGKATIGDNEVVVFTGQTNFVREQKAANLESALTASAPGRKTRFRSMAWEGDTVYEQWRDLNFGSWSSQLDAVGATMVVAGFGQVEALDGMKRLPEFVAAYHRLLDQFAQRTPRLVLVSPVPFEKPLESHAPDLSARNGDLRAYAEAIRTIARQRGLVFVDLVTPLEEQGTLRPRLTGNGMHLNDEGLSVVAGILCRSFGGDPSAAATRPDLRSAIIEKNRLWLDCWRPANWNFVYGDRVTQLFATATGDAPSLRQVFEDHKPMIAALEERIHGLASGATIAETVQPQKGEVATATEQLTPEAELATFTMADGYQANLFASEREGVVKPIQIAWDERGRCYVACSPTYPHVTPGAKPGDYILVLEDTDHDGRADKSSKFAEGLTMVQGLEPGAGGLYVCDYTEIVHLRDTDGDGRADKREVILSGFGTGDTHQLVNSISHGPDGSLWFTQGLHIFSRVETPWGLARLDKAGVWRFRPRTMRLDGFFSGGKAGHNCWGVAFDDYGQVFHKTGDRPDGYYTVPGMVRLADPEEYHGRGSILQTTAKTTSLDIIGTRALPADVQGCVVTGGFMANTMEIHRLLDDGSGFKTTQLPKLLKSTSDAFRPVDVSVGPDGAIYVADWFNRVIGHYQASYRDPRRDKAHGRIWRISARGHEPVRQPDLAGMAPRALLDQLRSPERWTRGQAKRLLSDGPTPEVITAADEWLSALSPADPDYERLLLEIIGVFEAHETVHPDLLGLLLRARDPRVRAYGTRVVGAWADRLPEATVLLRERIRDESPRVRLEAIVACSYLTGPEAVEIAVQALDSPRDRFIDYALAQSVRALQPRWARPLQDGHLGFGGNEAHSAYVRKMATASAVPAHPGKLAYDTLCLNCHQPDGKGLPGIYPPLAGSEWVRGDKAPLIKMLLHGLAGPITVAGQEYGRVQPLPMPPSGLDNDQVAHVLNYVRSTFGGALPPVTSEEVAALRTAHEGRSVMWTAAELIR